MTCGRSDCQRELAVQLVWRSESGRRWTTRACEQHTTDQYDVGRQLRLELVEGVGVDVRRPA